MKFINPRGMVVRHATRQVMGPGRRLDPGLGFALLRDPRVPVRAKAMALGAGAVLMTALVALEVPLEGLLALALPFVGPAIDLVADGAEETLGTVFASSLLLPYFAPRELVEQVRAERLGG